MNASDTPRVVVALGGNAISGPGSDNSVAQDYVNLRRSLRGVVTLIERGHEVVLTHGNGPQVGNQMIRVELARGQAPDLPLDVVVADLQGGLGYMIERVLRNKLLRKGLDKPPICALLTQVEVRRKDPAFGNPTKFVGPAFAEREVPELEKRGWLMKEDKPRGWRRVVPSPDPIRTVEGDLIRRLVDAGALVIVTGGGGIPVARSSHGLLKGVEAVVDKDLAAAVLAREVEASELYILTDVTRIALDFGTPRQSDIERMTAAEARRHLAAGQFPPGSMGPKVRAACQFVEHGGRRALVTSIYSLIPALDGETGTWIVP